LGAVGTLLGPDGLLLALLFTLFAGGAMGALYSLTAWQTQGARGPFKRYGSMLKYLWVTGRPSYVPPAPGEAMAQRLPFAVPIAIGTTATVLWAV
jgi:prepilin peptidase CpaA